MPKTKKETEEKKPTDIAVNCPICNELLFSFDLFNKSVFKKTVTVKCGNCGTESELRGKGLTDCYNEGL